MSKGDHPLVLVVEGSPTDREHLGYLLKSEGYEPITATTAAEGLRTFADRLPDLVILELDLPDHPGLDLCRELRTQSLVPIVVLSGRSDELDVVCALDIGADDYVMKPYRDRELAARVRAGLRRAPLTGTGGICDHRSAVCSADLCLDPLRYQATLGEEPLNLGRKEFELLEILVTNAGHIVPRQVLLDRVWGPDYMGGGRSLDMHITRLRQKLHGRRTTTGRIITARGLGYKYDPTPIEVTLSSDVSGEAVRLGSQ